MQSRRHLALSAAGPQADELVNQGRLAEAEALLRKGLRADPECFDLSDRLADVLLAQGRRGQALEEQRRTLACNPRTPEAYCALADTYDLLNLYDESARVMERYLRLWPDDARALHLFAYCCERAGRDRRALEAWRHLLQLVPNHVSARRGLARVRARLAHESPKGSPEPDEVWLAVPGAPRQSERCLSNPGLWM
jgi:tetratricopeptide (TPR) repeat protein